jgi:TPP-dependent 2-oxoacid decarboxylase
MPRGATFIGQVFYGSIGYSLGAALGACVAAPDRPLMLFIGDGSFQMTAVDLSTMIRLKLKPIIFLLVRL